MIKKIKQIKFLMISMYIILLFPFLISLGGGIKEFIDIKSNKKFAAGMIIIAILILFLISNIMENLDGIKKIDKFIFIPIIIFFGAFTIRMCSVYFIGNQVEQISDFLLAHNNAINGLKGSGYIATFSHWALYPKILGAFYYIFGNGFFVGQTINAILASMVSVLIYYISIDIFKSVKPAIIISAVYCLWPSNIFYVNIYTNEFFAMFFLTMSILIAIKCMNSDEIKKKHISIMLYILLGIVLAIADFFKPFSLIVIIAFIITQIIYNLSQTNFKNLKKIKLKNILISQNAFKIFMIIIMIFIYCIVKQIIFVSLEKDFGFKVNRSAIAYSAYVGLSSENQGVVSSEALKKYSDLIQSNNRDYKKANEEMIGELKEDLKENYKLLPKTLAKKMKISWFSEIQQVERWVVENINNDENGLVTKEGLRSVALPISQAYYVSMIFFIIIGIIFAFKRLDNNGLFLCALYILGIVCAFLITEAQGRYKSVIIPILAVLAGFGIYQLSLTIKNCFNKIFIKNNRL